jgi:hypothetical protein
MNKKIKLSLVLPAYVSKPMNKVIRMPLEKTK